MVLAEEASLVEGQKKFALAFVVEKRPVLMSDSFSQGIRNWNIAFQAKRKLALSSLSPLCQDTPPLTRKIVAV
uniref:Uncharacterized protein n=1 Tax=Romanomermis culicivorax TaxID=13658 RepID=A0A915I3H5_ROMCU